MTAPSWSLCSKLLKSNPFFLRRGACALSVAGLFYYSWSKVVSSLSPSLHCGRDRATERSPAQTIGTLAHRLNSERARLPIRTRYISPRYRCRRHPGTIDLDLVKVLRIPQKIAQITRHRTYQRPPKGTGQLSGFNDETGAQSRVNTNRTRLGSPVVLRSNYYVLDLIRTTRRTMDRFST